VDNSSPATLPRAKPNGVNIPIKAARRGAESRAKKLFLLPIQNIFLNLVLTGREDPT
jgi:hypothetical protein